MTHNKLLSMHSVTRRYNVACTRSVAEPSCQVSGVTVRSFLIWQVNDAIHTAHNTDFES